MKIWEAILMPDNGASFGVGLRFKREDAVELAKSECRKKWNTEDEYFWCVQERDVK